MIMSGYHPNSALHALFGVLSCTQRIFLQNSACSLNLVFVPFCELLVGGRTLDPPLSLRDTQGRLVTLGADQSSQGRLVGGLESRAWSQATGQACSNTHTQGRRMHLHSIAHVYTQWMRSHPHSSSSPAANWVSLALPAGNDY